MFWLAVAGLLVAGTVTFIASQAHMKATARPPSASCGSVNVLTDGLQQAGTGDAELCFVRAFRSCTPGSLDYIVHGVDTGERHVLRVDRSAAGCQIVDDVTGYGLTSYGLTSSRSTEVVCRGTQWDGTGWLLVGCVDNGKRPRAVRLWWPLQQGQVGLRPGQASPLPEPSP